MSWSVPAAGLLYYRHSGPATPPTGVSRLMNASERERGGVAHTQGSCRAAHTDPPPPPCAHRDGRCHPGPVKQATRTSGWEGGRPARVSARRAGGALDVSDEAEPGQSRLPGVASSTPPRTV